MIQKAVSSSTVSRNRLLYGLVAFLVMLLGLASRRFFGGVPFVRLYVGDGLWALMVFFLFALLFTEWPTRRLVLLALLASFSIEISQLYHAPWIDAVRASRLGGLVLGFTFVWSDFVCYSVGVLAGMLIDSQIKAVGQRAT